MASSQGSGGLGADRVGMKTGGVSLSLLPLGEEKGSLKSYWILGPGPETGAEKGASIPLRLAPISGPD